MNKKNSTRAAGMIPFPCCQKEKVIVYEGSHGKASCKCPRCGKFAVFNYDTMTAEISVPLRGAAHALQSNRDVSLSQ